MLLHGLGEDTVLVVGVTREQYEELQDVPLLSVLSELGMLT